jgi:hypothetical protein
MLISGAKRESAAMIEVLVLRFRLGEALGAGSSGGVDAGWNGIVALKAVAVLFFSVAALTGGVCRSTTW